MTTGTSAPPTGNTNNTPSTSASTAHTATSGTLDVATTAIPKPTAPSATAGVMICAHGMSTGRPVMSSCSLAKVTMLPVKLTLPTIALKTTAMISATESVECRCVNSLMETSAAAAPPTPLNMA